MTPVIVHFGPGLAELQLVDGGSALAYLFSIVLSPPNATWESHYFPMLISLSKCLFLAFGVVREQDGDDFTWCGVPIMASVMYLPFDAQKPRELDHMKRPLMFGSSIPSPPNVDEQNEEYKTSATVWRRKRILADTLRSLGTGQGLPDDSFELTPEVLFTLSRALHQLILGRTGKTDVKLKPLLCSTLKQTEQIKAELIKELIGQESFETVRLPKIWTQARTQGDLECLLFKLIDLSYQEGDHTDDIVVAYKSVLRFYLTPHVYRKDMNTGEHTVTEALDANQNERINKFVADLWQEQKELALAKLAIVKREHETARQDDRKIVTGQCAEVHPVVGIG